MGVYIKGMEMPCCCKECIMWNNESSLYGGCLAVSEREGIFDGKTNMEVRQPYCPLVPVPPHGDLVDRAEMREIAISLLDEAVTDQEANAIRKMWSHLRQMPVYIPAEEGET